MTPTTAQSTHAISWIPLINERIIRIVAERQGLKETELTLSVLVELAEQRIAIDTETILKQIQWLIRNSQLVGVDCDLGNNVGYTFVLPARSRVMITMPVCVTVPQASLN